MDIPKSWNCISREDFEVQLNMLKIVISRCLVLGVWCLVLAGGDSGACGGNRGGGAVAVAVVDGLHGSYSPFVGVSMDMEVGLITKRSDEVEMIYMEELMNFVHQHELVEEDYGTHFTTDEVFPSREDLLEWVRRVAYRLGFVIVIIRSDIANGKQGRKTYVLLVGHPYADKLKANEHSMLVDMTKNMVKPSSILRTLKENNEDNMTTIKQVYNARYSYKRSVRGPRTELQQLMMLLDRDNYLHWSTCHESSNIVSDIFWTHPNAVKLLNAFNIVFLMDTTYKTNKYRLPLLEIIGVTCTGLSFSAGFAFLSSEKEKNFIWALQKFKGSLLTSHMGPEVIVCDRDLALMSAINIVFPKARNLLCRFHINKNVKANCKMLVDSVEAWEVVMDSWRTIIDCTDIAQFDEFVKSFETICSPLPLLVEYVKNTWIIPHKEKFLYKMLVGFVSKHALILIAEEFDQVNDVGFDSECCGCVLRRTHGLPCACQLARYAMGVIPLNEVHVMWTRLSFSDLSECDSSSELSIQQEWDVILSRFK
ncbi:uncharacterized protein [Phaseolus vulgaris]|uniref:uncharacterized protein n=1 Tax=Phaseolus vulgaris TaxID=3885 RepID=UPI0035CC32CB